jgi:hypothetical protein
MHIEHELKCFKDRKPFNQGVLDHHYLRLDGDKVVSSFGSIFPSVMITKYLQWFDAVYLACKTEQEIEGAKNRAPKFGQYKVEHVTHDSVMFGCLNLRLADIREIAKEMKEKSQRR